MTQDSVPTSVTWQFLILWDEATILLLVVLCVRPTPIYIYTIICIRHHSDIGPLRVKYLKYIKLLLDTVGWLIRHPISDNNAAVKEISKLREGTISENDKNKNKNKELSQTQPMWFAAQ